MATDMKDVADVKARAKAIVGRCCGALENLMASGVQRPSEIYVDRAAVVAGVLAAAAGDLIGREVPHCINLQEALDAVCAVVRRRANESFASRFPAEPAGPEPAEHRPDPRERPICCCEACTAMRRAGGS